MTRTAQPDPHIAAAPDAPPGHRPGRTIGITRAQLALVFRPAGPRLTIAGNPIARDHAPRALAADRLAAAPPEWREGHEGDRDRMLVWH